MSRVPSLSSPFLLGFDEIQRALDRVVKGADGYPPYNIERLNREDGQPERLRITLAVAGFTRDQLDVCTEENQLVIRGRQQDDKARTFIHRGIAARHFQRTFVLAGSGHIAGVVNPPAKGKYGYWCNAQLPEDAEQWFADAERHPGSWWPHWLQWLTQYAGEQVPPREPGSADYPPLQAAPGSYVRVRAADAIAAGQRRAKRPA